MSISNSYPTQTPSLNLNFATGSDQFLDSRISFSRADTPPTYAAPSAVHYWSNEKHLSSENLLLHSQDFDTGWTASGISAPTGSQTSPAGDSTAWLLTCNSGTAIGPRILQSYSVAANTEYTMVAHLKAGTASHGWAVFRSDGTYQYAAAMLDFSAGTISVTSAGMTNASGTVTSLGSNWFRVTVTATTSTSVSSPFAQVGISDGTAIGQYGRPSWNPAGTETMYAWGVQLSSVNSLVYDSPTTTQISRSYSSTLKSVANAGDPRFEYDPTDGQSVAKGLLIEAQATNLTKYSNDFSSWGDTSTVAVTSNVGVAPNGQLEADLLVSPSSASAHYILDSTIAFTSGTTYTASVYVKSAGQRYVQLCGNTAVFGGPYQWVNYDLESGTLSANNCSGTITAVGNGYYRLTATMTASSTQTRSFILMFADSLSSDFFPTTTGDDYSGFLAYGFQTESGSSASSLISTNGSQVSRASDSCSVAVSDFAGFADTEGAVVVEATVNSLDSSNATAVSFSNAAGTEFIKTGYQVGGVTDQSVRAYVRGSSADQAYIDAGSVSATGSYKVGVRYEKNNVGASLNGASVVTDTVAIMPIGMNTLYIGSSASGTYPMNANLKRITYYSEPLSDTNLTALTSNP